MSDENFDDILLEETSYDFEEDNYMTKIDEPSKENEPTMEGVAKPANTMRFVSISDEPIEDKPLPPKIIKLTKPPGSNGMYSRWLYTCGKSGL